MVLKYNKHTYGKINKYKKNIRSQLTTTNNSFKRNRKTDSDSQIKKTHNHRNFFFIKTLNKSITKATHTKDTKKRTEKNHKISKKHIHLPQF